MKLRLPQSICAAILLSMSVVYADSIRPHTIVTVTGEENISADFAANAATTNAKAYVKDGQGTAIVNTEMTIKTPLIVREGTLKIQANNGTPITITSQNNLHNDYLTVGGTNAHLIIDNAHYTQKPESGNGYNKSISIGTPDGEGTVTLQNGGSMFSMQVTHIGRAAYANGCKGSYKTTDDTYTTTYSDNTTTQAGTLNIYSGSTASVGTVLLMGNGTVNADGGRLIGGSRVIFDPTGFATTRSGKVNRLGNDDGSTSIINVTNGGKADFYNRLYTGYGSNSLVEINVSGAGSSFNSYYDTFLGFKEDVKGATLNSQTTISVTNEATAHITNGVLGYISGNTASLYIDESSTLTGSSITVNKGSEIYNDGTVTLTATDEQIIQWQDDNNPDPATSTTKPVTYNKVDSKLELNGGIFTNSGSLAATKLTVKNGGTFEITGNKAYVNIEKLSLEPGSKFVVNAEVSNENTTEPVVGGRIDGDMRKGAMTINFIPTENLKAGTYKIFEKIWDFELDENLTLTGIDVPFLMAWETPADNDLMTFVIRLHDQLIVRMDPLADAVQAGNWGVFESSQAFTGVLWAPHTNAVVLTQPDATQSTGYKVAWATAYSQFSEIGGSKLFTDHDYSIYGAAVGGEHRFASGRRIGIALGHDRGKASPTGVGHVDQTSWHAAFYGCAGLWNIGSQGTLSADWSVAAGTTESEHKRSDAEWEQDNLQLDARATYTHKLSNRLYMNGFVGVQYYVQDGVRTARIHTDSMHNLRMMLGGGVSYIMDKTTLFGELSIHNDTIRRNPDVNADGFRFGSGANPGRFGGSFSAGAEYRLNDKWTLRGSYGFECSADHKQHNLNFGAMYSF